jgi:hypothetical protein
MPNLSGDIKQGRKKNDSNQDIQQRVLVLLLLCIGLPAA